MLGWPRCPWILQPSPPQCLDTEHSPPSLIFYVDSGEQTRVLTPHSEHFADPAMSPTPVRSIAMEVVMSRLALPVSLCDTMQSMPLAQYPAWKTYMEFSFPQYRIFPLSSPHHLPISCEIQIVTKITSSCNIWKPKQTQEKSCRREEPGKQETQRGEQKDVKTRWPGPAAREEVRGPQAHPPPSSSESSENRRRQGPVPEQKNRVFSPLLSTVTDTLKIK